MIKKSIKQLEYSEYASDKPKVKIDLSYIENSSISKKAISAINKHSNRINYYHYSQNEKLINLISKSLGIKSDYIFLTSGCDGALKHISETFLEKNDKVLIPVPTFPRYEFHVKVMEAEPYFIYFSEFPFEFDLDVIYKKVKEINPKLIFLCNPNNPTGHFIAKDKIEKFLKKVNRLVVLDEALAEYTGVSCVDLVKKYSNLIVTRSFSKLYGLAGLRIGYFVANPWIGKEIAKTISPFELTGLSIDAAKAVLRDKELVKNTIDITNKGLRFVKKNLELNYSNSSSSVILIYGEGNKEDLYKFLLKKGILVISGDHFKGLEGKNCIRVSIGSGYQLNQLIKVLNSIFQP